MLLSRLKDQRWPPSKSHALVTRPSTPTSSPGTSCNGVTSCDSCPCCFERTAVTLTTPRGHLSGKRKHLKVFVKCFCPTCPLIWIHWHLQDKVTGYWSKRKKVSLQCRSIKSKGLGCVLSSWAEGGLKCDGVKAITKAKLTSPRRSKAEWIFIKFSTIRENLICQFNYEAGAQEGFGLDSVSPGDSPSIPVSHDEKETQREREQPFDQQWRETWPRCIYQRKNNEWRMRGEGMQVHSSVAITPLHGLLCWENKQYPHTTN